MEKRTLTRKWHRDCVGISPKVPYGSKLGAGASGRFIINNEPQYFTIHPRVDLICLQPLDFSTVEWSGVWWSSGLFDLAEWPNPLAIEYNREAVIRFMTGDCCDRSSTRNPWAEAILEAVGEAVSKNVWILDRRLRRRKGSPVAEARQTFHGLDCRLVEADWETHQFVEGEGESEMKYGKRWTVFDFIDSVKDKLEQKWYDEQEDPQEAMYSFPTTYQ